MSEASVGAPMNVRVMTAQSGIGAFRIAFRSLLTGFPGALRLAWRLFVRDTQGEHRQSLLGYLWVLIPVLANTLVWVFLHSQKLIEIDSGGVPYGLFVLSGVVLWTAFNGAVMGMLGVVPLGRGLLLKVSFPQEALVYSAMIKTTLDAFLAAVVLVPALIYFLQPLATSMLLYPAALMVCLLAGWATALIFVPIAALYKDVSRVIQLALRFGFFVTPVIFALPRSGQARQLMLLNPITPLIVTGRSWLTGSGEEMSGLFLANAGAAALLFLLGFLILKVALPYVIERIGA